MRLFFIIFITYLIGSIPTGYLFAKFTRKIDIRLYGSGNVGATNVLRVIGKVPAILTLVLDILKGFVAVTFWAEISYSFRMQIDYPAFLALLGLCVVIGHNYSIFLEFKGGKGVATSLGVLMGLCPKLLIAGICIWVIVFIFSRIVSLASIVSAIVIPLGSYYFEYPGAVRFLTVVLAFLILVRHRDNIIRLINNKEDKISVKTQKS